VKRRYGDKEKCRRSFTREYYVQNDRESVQVCKEAFKSIFSVSDGRISRALKAQALLDYPHTE